MLGVWTDRKLRAQAQAAIKLVDPPYDDMTVFIEEKLREVISQAGINQNQNSPRRAA
jgi:hypothetical protein